MRKKLLTAVSAALAVCMLFAGCGQETPSETTLAPETTQTPETTPVSDPVPETTAVPETIAVPETTQAPAADMVNVYIGKASSGFKEYPVELTSELSPDALIAAIETLTGWNLTLSEPVTMGKGGMTVIFSSECALLSGPPAQQKEEFWMYDVDTLVVTVLDSIQETLRRNYVGEGGDPTSLDIYFSIENNDIDIPNANIHYSQYEPWDSSAIYG